MTVLAMTKGPALEHDGPIALARGINRFETRWKNTTTLWSALLARLQETTRTPETQAEYNAMTKQQQDDIKDVGGFVGGVLTGGRRKTETVASRQLVTLDADFAPAGMAAKIVALSEYAVAIYSTHKHSPIKPRLRFLIPLARPVNPEEYKAIARRLAADIGLEYFDDTTYDPARLMYWPSTSKDAEYVFDYTDAPFVDPDAILATYQDWHDASQWPTSDRAAAERVKTADRQGDPLTKRGVIGAFCRAYTITEAIATFLQDEYTPCEQPNRYTYTKGSTAGGLIIYDDKFAYSHHGTDPASERLVNAFDLVRVHRFGGLDAEAKPDSPTIKLPSYKAMREWAVNQGPVKRELATADFSEPLPDGPEVDNSWKDQLTYTDNGGPRQTINNALVVLRNDPALVGAVGYDEFICQMIARKSLPWQETDRPRTWTDVDDAGLRHYMEHHYKIKGSENIHDALALVTLENRYHPVREYLDGLKWDGQPRLDRLLIDVMGAADNEYTKAVTRKWLTAACARARCPGCKFDYMLVLKGAQGVGKSRLLALLGRQDLGWFSDAPVPFDDAKAAVENTSGKWLVELGELSGLRKAEVEHVKRFISSQGDTVRQAYNRRAETYLRQCVFAGSTNRGDYLSDPTGNRRFWPVDVDPVLALYDREEYLQPATVDQIWAEADMRYRTGERLYLNGDLEVMANERQLEHAALDERAAPVAEYLDTLLPEEWYKRDKQGRAYWLSNGPGIDEEPGTLRRTRVCALEIWVECFGKREADLTRRESQAITDIMLQIPGWYRCPKPERIPGYGLARIFVRT